MYQSPRCGKGPRVQQPTTTSNDIPERREMSSGLDDFHKGSYSPQSSTTWRLGEDQEYPHRNCDLAFSITMCVFLCQRPGDAAGGDYIVVSFDYYIIIE